MSKEEYSETEFFNPVDKNEEYAKQIFVRLTRNSRANLLSNKIGFLF